jgi:hypothetical protein
LKASDTHGRNQRTIVLTGASPSLRPVATVIRDDTEKVVVESGGLIGLTYV